MEQIKTAIESLKPGQSTVYFKGETGEFYRYLNVIEMMGLMKYFQRLQAKGEHVFCQKLVERSHRTDVGIFEYRVKRKAYD